ncbi:hypothetical protein N7474_004164 [Penicillium riverlandense]|uniref:uncharacterized protein n=1 Tax=Penicillium riverlandense TaxID=1903569 RepID=UPI0025490EB1|nr:uncharacterized protein N7474_004164 [Penicillium riverlandense]KAJ5818573.1 hypothetical protein N7474_004164 [Penicillium riverlandense]
MGTSSDQDAKAMEAPGHNHIELASTGAAADQVTPEADIETAKAIAPEEVRKYSRDDDEAMKAMADYDGPPLVLDAETNKRLLRTIDWHMLPVLCCVFGLNYLDKTTLSYASIMGIEEDINLTKKEYSWLGSIFYIGWLVWEYPTSRLLQWLPLAKYSAFCVTTWGVVLAVFATVSNFQGAMAIRFLLGMFEAASMPAFALISSQWYTVREHNLRTGFWISANGWGQIIGGLVAYGISRRISEVEASIAGWKLIFVATGCFTTCVGLLFFYIIPDSQLNCRWLNQRDRLLAIQRVRENEQGIGNRHFKWYQFKEAFFDPLTWALFAYGVLSDIPNGGLTNFFSQLIVGFGYTPQQSLLYGIPGGAVVIIACWTNGFVGDRLQNRTLVSCGPMTCALVGIILIVALPISHNYNIGRLVGYYMTQALPATGASVLSLISSNIAGYTKKTTVAALYLIGYCLGNVIGPQTFSPGDAPRYVPAEITILVCFALCICDLLFINWWCRRENRRKSAVRANPGYARLDNQGWRDFTDRENPEFVYSL